MSVLSLSQKREDDASLPSWLHVHRCCTAGDRNVLQLVRTSANECEMSESATRSNNTLSVLKTKPGYHWQPALCLCKCPMVSV